MRLYADRLGQCCCDLGRTAKRRRVLAKKRTAPTILNQSRAPRHLRMRSSVVAVCGTAEKVLCAYHAQTGSTHAREKEAWVKITVEGVVASYPRQLRRRRNTLWVSFCFDSVGKVGPVAANAVSARKVARRPQLPDACAAASLFALFRVWSAVQQQNRQG